MTDRTTIARLVLAAVIVPTTRGIAAHWPTLDPKAQACFADPADLLELTRRLHDESITFADIG